MDAKIQADYKRIIEMCYKARNTQEAQVVLFYAELLCQQLGFDNSGLTIDMGYCGKDTLQPLHTAIWYGIGQALAASPCHISAFEPVRIDSYRGRLIKIELKFVIHSSKSSCVVDSNLKNLLSYVESVRTTTEIGHQQSYL